MREYNIGYILNVTPKCPNVFEGEGMVYKRIAVSDTGSQKLVHHFPEAFDFIGLYWGVVVVVFKLDSFKWCGFHKVHDCSVMKLVTIVCTTVAVHEAR